MSLYKQWQKECEKERSPQEQNMYWGAYFEVEKEAYRTILISQNPKVEGTVAELADKFEMTKTQVAGFIDGINTSLETEIDLDSLKADTQVTLNIVWEELFKNMLKAKAEWLYNLKEWEPILDEDKRLEFKREYRLSQMAVSQKVGRNDPCPCGSGKKYKKCCGA